MLEAFPEDTAPRYLLQDRDKICGEDFRQRFPSGILISAGQWAVFARPRDLPKKEIEGRLGTVQDIQKRRSP